GRLGVRQGDRGQDAQVHPGSGQHHRSRRGVSDVPRPRSGCAGVVQEAWLSARVVTRRGWVTLALAIAIALTWAMIAWKPGAPERAVVASAPAPSPPSAASEPAR